MEGSFRAGVGTMPDTKAGSEACRVSFNSLFKLELRGQWEAWVEDDGIWRPLLRWVTTWVSIPISSLSH